MNNEINVFIIKDKNGKDIYNGNTVYYNKKTYVILYIEKNDLGWILSPCGNNPDSAYIPVPENISSSELEVV